MGIFGAMTTAVSGLSAQAFALENISGNIANSQTTGFKRVETAFSDLIPDGGPRRDLSGSVTALSRATNTVQGQLAASAVPTHMAINGDGYFVVQQSIGYSDNQPVFTGVNAYTRRGDFELDRNGYMVNQSNNYLLGLPLDPRTGNPIGSTPRVVRISNDVIAASATTNFEYRASLPSTPRTPAYDATIPGSELLPTALATPTITTANVPNFIAGTVEGGFVTMYDSQGNQVDVQMRWGKINNASAGPPAVQDTWRLYYQNNSQTGTESWTQISGDFTFDIQGRITAPTSNPTITALTVNNRTIGDVTLNIGTNGLSQYARAGGNVDVTQIAQNGFAAGKLASISTTETGRVRATYTNGQLVDMFQVPIATFNGDNMLKRMDGGTFAETAESGSPIFSSAGRILSRLLEASNVDISEEFTKLIVTQQAYAANTRIVTTSNQMLQETVNMVR